MVSTGKSCLRTGKIEICSRNLVKILNLRKMCEFQNGNFLFAKIVKINRISVNSEVFKRNSESESVLKLI
jgi:hypothetical protein